MSLDLIFGLPASLGRRWDADLAAALALEPEHLSLYGLTVEADTPLGRWTARGEVVPVDEDRYAAEFLTADTELGRAGFEHYEVSNSARAGHRARHNCAYWRPGAVHRARPLGPQRLGPGATVERARVGGLPTAVDRGADPADGHEWLDDEALAIEELYLGLRTSEGLPADRIEAEARQRWAADGWAEVVGGRLRLTAEGWLRLDALVAHLTRYQVGS